MDTTLHIAPPDGVKAHLEAHLHRRQLDRALAQGIPPESAAPLALRARWLTALSRRRVIAAGLRQVIRETCRGVSPLHARVTPQLTQVVAASDDLNRLADELATPGPVAARGVAQAWILLTDGTGPLYNAGSTGNLRARAASAADHLLLDS
jgi:hypothetical protein